MANMITVVNSLSGAPLECLPYASAMQSKLAQEYRWFRFKASVITFDQPIDLMSIGGHCSFQGSGWNLTQCVRDDNMTEPLVKAYSSGNPRYLYLKGLTFDGRSASVQSTAPLLELTNVDGSYFERCRFVNNDGSGCSFGKGVSNNGNLSMSRFVSCEWSANARGAGLEVHSGEDISFIGCSFLNNYSFGAIVNGPPPTQRGLVSFIACRVSGNGSGGGGVPGVGLNKVIGATVENCFFGDNLHFYSATSHCHAEQNLFKSATFINQGTSNTSVQNWMVP